MEEGVVKMEEEVTLQAKDLDSSQIIWNVMEYLQELKKEGKINEDNAESIDVAIQCLSSTFNVSLEDEDQKKKYSIKPQTLPTVLGLGLAGKDRIQKEIEKLHKLQQQIPGSDVDAKFARFIHSIKKTGFFNGATPGSAEYEQRFFKARQKFMEKEKAKDSKPAETKPSVETPPIQSQTPILSPEEKLNQAEKHKMDGNNRLQEKQYSKAVESYSKAIELNPENPIYYSNRAAAYSHLGKHDEAIRDCQKSISLKPDYGKAYGRLGLAYFSLGKYKEACEQYKKALELEPNSPSIRESLSAAEKKLQDGTQTSSSTSTPPTTLPISTPLPATGTTPSTPPSMPDILSQMGSMFGQQAQGNQAPTSPRSANATPSTGTAPRPAFNLGDIMSNPMFQNFASQMMNNPAVMNMANNMMSNPDAMNSMMRNFGLDPSQFPDETQPDQPPPQ